jgi:hypothetical protein
MSLQFNDTSPSKNGLIQECETQVFGNYGVISSDADLLATFTRNLNNALNMVASMIMSSDGRWQWDDNNNTDFPIATTNLVTTVGAEQQDYSFDVTFLKILRVEVQDADGNWHLLKPIDKEDIYNQSLTDFLKTAGLPKYYDKIGNSLFLYPKPLGTAVTSSLGLKVYYQRPPAYFTISDTDTVPGINSLFHKLVALIASRDYALDRGMANAKTLVERVVEGQEALTEFYTLRNKDEHLGLRPRRRSYA